jgi:hypothetical protein
MCSKVHEPQSRFFCVFYLSKNFINCTIVKGDSVSSTGPCTVGDGPRSVIIIANEVCNIACPAMISWISKYCTVWWHLILTRCQSLRRYQNGWKAPMPELGPKHPVMMTVQHCPIINLPTLFEMRTVYTCYVTEVCVIWGSMPLWSSWRVVPPWWTPQHGCTPWRPLCAHEWCARCNIFI